MIGGAGCIPVRWEHNAAEMHHEHRRLVLLALLTLGLGLAAQAPPAPTFPAPRRWLTFANAITPREYAQLQPLIASQSLGEGAVSAAGPVSVSGVDFGSLGRGWLVSYLCRSENCPAVAFVQQGTGFRQVLKPSWAGAFTVGPSGGAVPYLYGWNHVGAGMNSVTRYSYNGERFVTDGCVNDTTDAACGAATTTVFPVPPLERLPSISPDEFAPLRPLLEAEAQNLPAAGRARAIAGAHFVNLGRYTAAATANCDVRGDCPIYVFDHQGATYKLVVRASGDAIGETAPQPGDPLFPQPSLVIRRHAANGGTELVRYDSERPPRNYSGVLPVPFATWAAGACELQHGTALDPVYCANGAPVPAPAIPLDRTAIKGAAQDATGTVWGVAQTGLERWRGDHWEPVAPLVSGAVTPASAADGRWVWPAEGGGVEVAWITLAAPLKLVVVWHRGNDRKLEFEIPRAGAVLPDASGAHLLLDPDGVSAIGADGTLRRVFTFQPDERTPAPTRANQNWPFQVTADAQGRLWISQPHFTGPRIVSSSSLLGFVIDDHGQFSYHASLPGLPSGTLAFLAPWDERHLVAHVSNVGLFLIDTQALTAQPLTPPAPGALLQAQMVISDRADRYVVVGTPAQVVQTPSGDLERTGVVWRWRDGQWQRVLVGLDGRGVAQPRADLATGDGVWISSTGEGVWFIPKGSQPPVLANWRARLPLSEVSGIFPLGGGKLLLTDQVDHASLAVSSDALKQPSPASATFTILDHPQEAEPELDANRHLWTLRLHSLDEWNGASWRAHPLPLAIAPGQVSGIMADTHGSIWVLPAPCRMGPAAALDSTSGTWRVFGSYILGLLRAGYPVNAVHDRYRLQPLNGPGGQIMSWGYCNGVSYFNGRRWSIWNVGQFPGPANAIPQAPPYYDASGRPAVNMGVNQSFAWDGASWQPIPYRPEAPEPPSSPAPPAPPPANCPTLYPTSLATDALGRQWWTAAGNLYESSSGRCSIVLDAHQAQPFVDGRKLGRALADAQGNVFLQTWPSDRYVFLKAPF